MMKNVPPLVFVLLFALVFAGSVPAVAGAFMTRWQAGAGRESSAPPPSSSGTTASAPTWEPPSYAVLSPGETADQAASSAPSEAEVPSQPTETSVAPVSSQAVPPVTPPSSAEPAAVTSFPPVFAGEKGSFSTVDRSYFDDALFVGDSRTDDLYQYGTLPNATFYAGVGMSVYNIHKKPAAEGGVRGVMFSDFIRSRRFGKVFVMLGFNEATYSLNRTVQEMQALLDEIRAAQPDALLFVEANLHVTKHASETDPYEHNEDIRAVNERLAALADGERVFFIDVNPVFCDEAGNLHDDLTGDGIHLYAKHYRTWCDWLLTRGVALDAAPAVTEPVSEPEAPSEPPVSSEEPVSEPEEDDGSDRQEEAP